MEIKKYRLGNQSTEYKLVTKYLGWLPDDGSNWRDFFSLLEATFSEIKDKEATITDPEKNKKITIIIDRQITKDAFPISFYGEERSKDWSNFCIVSNKEKPSEKFIIPLY